MPLARLELSIDDSAWPNLRITGERISATGERVAFDQKVQYDIAYSQFENLLHNQLRPMVTQLIERRKRS